MKIALGSDHGGFDYKKELISFLNENGYETVDIGTFEEGVPASWSVYGVKTAQAVASGEADFGIVICRSGIGVSIAANKVKGIYCGLVYNDTIAEKCMQHDGCNMIAFGADYVSIEDAKRQTLLYLNAKFEGGRHLARLNQLKDYENSKK